MLNIDNLTKNLATYSQEANNASEAIAKGLLLLGVVILGIFFMIELMNWKHFLERHKKEVSTQLWLEFSIKYLIAFVLIFTSGYILDAIMELSIMITNKVNSIYPPNTYAMKYTEAEIDGWILRNFINLLGWIIEKVSNAIIYIIIFMRYVDLYFLKALAPIMIGFYFSDEFRPTVLNFFKTFIVYALLGVVLLIFTILFGMLITTDLIKASTEDSSWVAFIELVKGIIYILIITGSVRKTKSLVGVQ